MSHSKLKTAKNSGLDIDAQFVFAGRYAPLRIHRIAMRHTEPHLAKIFRTQRYWTPIVVGAKGEVLAGFGQAQLTNQSIFGRYAPTVKYSEVTKSYIRGYIKWIKKVARREKWDKRMLAVELQYLQDAG